MNVKVKLNKETSKFFLLKIYNDFKQGFSISFVVF